MIRRVFGALVLLIGLFLAGWIAYNLIDVQPAAEGRSPLPAVLVAGLFIWVGSRWARGQEAG